MTSFLRWKPFSQVSIGPKILGQVGAFRRSFWTPILKRLGIRYRRPYNMRHSYATAMLMAGMTPAFCAKQLGHSIEMFLTTYAKWMDGEQNALEMARLESTLLSPSCPPQSKTGA